MLGGAVPGNIVLPSETQFFRRRWNFNLLAASGGGDNGIGGSRNGKKLSLSFITGGYKRIPMDTAGAYQLIDDDTGDRVIVWGGADTDSPDSPLPSKEALSWKPHPQGQGQPKPREGGGVEVEPSPHVRRRSFNRLKAPKVKALITKSSKITSKGSVTDNRKSSVCFDDTVADCTNSQPPLTSNSRFTRLLEHEKLVDDMVTDEKVQGRHSVHIRAGQCVEAAQGHRSGSKVVASRGWSNAAAPVYNTSYSQLKQPRKMSTDHGFFSRKSFKVLGASDDIIKSLINQCFLRPSHIQALAYGPVLEGKSCIIADQSGSGKTLAYLAPVIQCLRQEELEGLSKSSSKSPRVVVLVPTTELASQVLNNCRTISKSGVPFRSMVATGGFRQKTQLDNLQQEMDVLIATPGRFIFLLQEGFVQLTNLRCVVLDEVDILFNDEGFEQVLQSLISYAPMDSQYLFVTATLPVDIYNKLVEVFPDCEVIMGPGIHRTSSRLEEVLVDCSGDQEEKSPDTAFLNKKSALLQLVEESPVPKTIVFCNKIETCRKVENILKRFDRKGHNVKVLPFHAALELETRLANMKDFLNSQSKDSMFLICTDRASRGIDFPNVNHVVLFDFPRDPSEYVRRVGRTARGAGGKGKAFAFAVGKQVSLARRVMERNRKGHPLHGVPCAYQLEGSAF